MRTDLHENYETFLHDHYSKGYFTGKQSCGAYIDYKDDKPMIVRNMKKFIQEIKNINPAGSCSMWDAPWDFCGVGATGWI